MNIMKHVGKYGEKPCVVVFREVPNEPENCLIVQTSNLPEVYHDELMSAVQSPEAQQANNIAEVLNRKLFKDGSNILTTLHYQKYIQKVPVSLVTLSPTPSQDIALADLNAELRKIEGGYVPPKNDEAHLKESTSPKMTDSSAIIAEGSEDQAEGLLVQAQLMKEDAQRMLAEAEAKMEQAYALNPELKPKKKPGRPKKES